MYTRLRVPGDFCLTERIHVNYFIDRLGATGTRSVTHVAIQHGLGLLPERRAGSGVGYSAGPCINGPSLDVDGKVSINLSLWGRNDLRSASQLTKL